MAKRSGGGFWSTFESSVVQPFSALRDLEVDPAAPRKGVVLLLIITLVYTSILVALIAVGYPAAAPSVLPLTVGEQYRVQIWYQGPLFFATNALTAVLLLAVGRLLGQRSGFGLPFARISFASVIPFFFTTMIIELALAVLLFAGVVQPMVVMDWLTGTGSWFPLVYQLVSIVWMVALFSIAAYHTLKRGWLAGMVGGLFALALYAVPVALLIR